MELWRRLSTRERALTGAALFLSVFLLYLRSSPASIYLDDSGETVTVAALLGVGHPPGYPLHSLFGRLAASFPWGGLPWRVNALAVIWGALFSTGIGLLALMAAQRQRLETMASLLAAAGLCAIVAVGPVQWHQALGAKGGIYQLNNLLSLGLLWLASRQDRRGTAAFWLLLGLASAHHYMSQLPLLPAYAWLLWPRRRQALRSAWLLLPGIALYAYLPLRSSLHPGLAWGRFESWQDFWFFFFRLQYAAGELTRSAGTSLAQLAHALRLIGAEGSWLLSLLAATALWRGRRERWTQALGAGLLFSILAVSLYLNLKAERLDLMRPYLFPAYLCQALLAAEGLAMAIHGIAAPWTRALPALGLALGLLLAPLRWPLLSLREHYYALDNARGLLQALPRNSLLLAQGDALIFPLWYLQRVRHERDDVAVVGLAVLPMEWVRQDLGRRHPDLLHPRVLGPIGAESVPALTNAYLSLNGHRPRYAAFNRFDPPVPGWKLQSDGPAWTVLPGASLAAEDRAAAGLKIQSGRLRGFFKRPLDPRTLTLIVGDRAIQANSLGVAAEEAQAPLEALQWYRLAQALHPESPDYPFNQGNALYAAGRLPEAVEAFRAAVTVEPDYKSGWYNLGVTLNNLGRLNEAKLAFQTVLRLDPSNNDVRQVLKTWGP